MHLIQRQADVALLMKQGPHGPGGYLKSLVHSYSHGHLLIGRQDQVAYQAKVCDKASQIMLGANAGHAGVTVREFGSFE
jgi:hypothetical protein